MPAMQPILRFSIACMCLAACAIHARGEVKPDPKIVPGVVFQVGGVGGIGLMAMTTHWSAAPSRSAARDPRFHLDAWQRPHLSRPARHASIAC